MPLLLKEVWDLLWKGEMDLIYFLCDKYILSFLVCLHQRCQNVML